MFEQCGSNSPFTISSSVTFDQLRILIAEKLDRFPGLLKLCYRLNIDKAKDDAITIYTAEELEIFKDRMRLLIVSQWLSNGKISMQTLRPVTVFFEDLANSGSSG